MKFGEMINYQSKEGFKKPLIPRAMIYGSTAKTTLLAGLSEYKKKKVIELSPRGSSSTVEFDDFVTIPVDGLDDLRAKVKTIKNGLRVIKDTANRLDDKKYLKALKESTKYDYDYVLKWAKKREYPIEALVVSEYGTVNNWVYNETSDKLKADGVVGDDDKSMGMDWNVLSRDIMDEFHSISSMDIMTIFLTGEIFPKENKATEYFIKPDICVGKASRQIIDDLDGLFRTRFKDEKYEIIIKDTKGECKTKQKLESVYSKEKTESVLDITSKPEDFWKYVEEMNNKKIKAKKANKK